MSTLQLFIADLNNYDNQQLQVLSKYYNLPEIPRDLLVEKLAKKIMNDNVLTGTMPDGARFTGIEELDRKILLDMGSEDLKSVCSTNKTIRKICDSELFWKEKLQKDYYFNLKDINGKLIYNILDNYLSGEINSNDILKLLPLQVQKEYIRSNPDAVVYYASEYPDTPNAPNFDELLKIAIDASPNLLQKYGFYNLAEDTQRYIIDVDPRNILSIVRNLSSSNKKHVIDKYLTKDLANIDVSYRVINGKKYYLATTPTGTILFGKSVRHHNYIRSLTDQDKQFAKDNGWGIADNNTIGLYILLHKFKEIIENFDDSERVYLVEKNPQYAIKIQQVLGKRNFPHTLAPAVQMAAVKGDVSIIEQLETPTPEAVMYAIKQDPQYINLLKDPTQREAVVRNNPQYYKYLQNPSDSLKEYMEKYHNMRKPNPTDYLKDDTLEIQK